MASPVMTCGERWGGREPRSCPAPSREGCMILGCGIVSLMTNSISSEEILVYKGKTT
jgi:hypothetical protein